MNQLYTTQPQKDSAFDYFENKMAKGNETPFPRDSLFSLLESFVNQAQPQNDKPQNQINAFFHPVEEETKEISIVEILSSVDDVLFGNDDLTLPMPVPLQSNSMAIQNVGLAPHIQSVQKPVMQEGMASISSSQTPNETASAQMPNKHALTQMRSIPTRVLSTPLPVPSCDLDEVKPLKKVLSSKKRSRDTFKEQCIEDDSTEEGRFRPYQSGQWAEKYDELCEYRKRFGNCNVSHIYKENLPLHRWVKRQRFQFTLMMQGKASTLTPGRVTALNEINFVWDSQGVAWIERLEELRKFRATHFHTNVPSNYSPNQKLAVWVKCQRRQYRLLAEGKPSNMTPQRIRELEALDFEWELRAPKRTCTC